MSGFKSTFEYKLIYIIRVNDEQHKGLLKIGDATVHTDKPVDTLFPNCKELNAAAKARIKTYTQTISVAYDLLHTEIAVRTVCKDGVTTVKAFRDKTVHNVLNRSGIKRHEFGLESEGVEWYETDLATAIKAIAAVKEGKSSLNPNDITTDRSPIVFRPEQAKAIKETIAQFKKSDRMLWNAKMRFGKTLSALQVAKQMGFKKTIIFTHRPVVSDGWYEDFTKIFYDTNYVFGSKSKGEPIETLADSNIPFVYFASIQDLRGSAAVGGKFDKNELVFLVDWDFVVIDEAHEGTQTKLGKKVIETVLEGYSNGKRPKMLELSGTPFNLLDSFKEGEIYTWDYIMEQRAKKEWPLKHFGDSNPYEELPQLEIYTYDLDKSIPGYLDVADGAFNFREFFRTWTGDINKDFKPVPDGVHIGDFVHKNDVLALLNLLTKSDNNTNYPFATEAYRSYYRHTLCMVPGVKEAKALSKLLQAHPVFGSGAFNIVNVAGEGDEEQDSRDALKAVREAIGTNPDDHYSITLSCGRLTTGVTVPEWTAVFMLAGSFSTSASNYLQTIFRVQTPANINGRIKEYCSVFDFAPDRTLKMVAEAGHLSSRAGNVSNDKVIMGEFLNFCPVISLDGSSMQKFNVDKLLQQLKKAYTDRVVKNGFDDKHLYNDNLLKLDDIELNDFEELKKIVGASKQAEKVNNVDVNNQGFTDEEYAEIERIEKKPKKERTPEELALLEDKKKKRDNAQKAMSILRGISIRIPLLVYGAEVPVDKDITADNFVELIDDSSWNEFMPNGVTKEIFKKFSKYYEQDVFIAAGRAIRNIALAADELSPVERVQKLAEQFATFKNPDKETVLTPWRVVNMHMSDCLGGWCFYNEDFTETIEEPRFVDHGDVTADTFANVDAKILEINSKTGLYPLYVTYSIFRKRLESIPVEQRTIEKQYELWIKTVEENVFVICKTPMAKAITKRTLLGYRTGKINAHAFDDLINQLKEKPQQFRDKVLRGNTWGKKESVMKFNAVVGNPPYQVITKQATNGNNNITVDVYNYFRDSALSLSKIVSLIYPAKDYQRGLENFLDNNLVKVRIYNGSDKDGEKNIPGEPSVFGSAVRRIPGDVGVYLWNGDHPSRLIQYQNCFIERTEKIMPVQKGFFTIAFKLASCVNTSRDYSIRKCCESNFVEKNPTEVLGEVQNRSAVNPVGYTKVLTNNIGGSGGKAHWYYIKTAALDYIQPAVYKVVISSAYPNEAFKNPKSVEIIGPDEMFGRTKLCLYYADTFADVKGYVKYLNTRFVRAVAQMTPCKFLYYLPDYNIIKNDIDWNLSISEIDKQLYAKYNLNETEISFIESMIKPME